jgi:hypothetical protein
MISGGTASIAPGSPATLTPPNPQIVGVEIVNQSFYLCDVACPQLVGQVGPLSYRTFMLQAPGNEVTVAAETPASGATGTGTLNVYWLETSDQPGEPGSAPASSGYTLVGTIAAGQTTAAVSPGAGATALIITGVASGTTVTAAGATSGIALPVGLASGQWAASLPAGPGDSSITVTLSASQAKAAYVYQTTNQAVVLNLPATSGGSTLAGVLATTSYNPGSLTTYTKSGAALAALDTTNLVLTFIAPSDGKVNVYLEAVMLSSVAGIPGIWGLLNATGGSQVGPAAQVGIYQASSSVASLGGRQGATFCLTGLTPNQSYSLQWAMASESAGDNQTVYAGGSAGPATMQAIAA